MNSPAKCFWLACCFGAATTAQTLTAPSNLTTEAVSTLRVKLDWTDNSSNEQGFKIERKSGTGGTFQEIAVVSADKTTYSDDGLTPQTQYCYRVRAFDATGHSNYSNECCAVTTQAPEINCVNPNTAMQAQRVEVAIAAQNVDFVQGNTKAWLARGDTIFNASSMTVTGKTSLRAVFFIFGYTSTGLTDVFVQDKNGIVATLRNGFTILPGLPANLVAVQPNFAEQSQTLTVTITGQNTHFAQGSGTSSVRFQQGSSTIHAGSINASNDLSLSASFTIPPTAPSGFWNVDVQTFLDGSLTLSNGFRILLAPPTNLTTTAISNMQINLGWIDNSGTELGYRIERKIGFIGTYQEIAVVGANATNYQNTGLTPQTLYCYRVRAFDANGNSAYSNESCATTLNLPAALVAISPDRAEQSRMISVTITGQNTHFTQGSGTASVSFIQGSSTINATGSFATSDQSLSANFTIPRTAPTGLWDVAVLAPIDGLLRLTNGFNILLISASNLTATPISNTQINLGWIDNSGTELGYRIERKIGFIGTYQEIAVVGANATNYQNTGLTPQTLYCYRVRAFDANGNSAYSNEICATTSMLPTLAAVTPNQAEQNQTLTVTITGQNTHFTPGSSTVSLQFSQGSSTLSINANSVNVINGLSLQANFTLQRNAATGFWSVVVQTPVDGVLTLSSGFRILLGSPTSLTATTISNSQINLSWTDNSGTEREFRIERKIGSGAFQEIAIVEANTTAYQNHGLTPQTLYCYRVRAADGLNVSNYSNEACVSTPTSVSAGRSVPAQYQLAQNYPNPFSPLTRGSFDNPQTQIEYSLAERGEVRLEIFDVHGRKIRTLIQANQPASQYAVIWDGKDEAGVMVPSGIYFYRLQAGGFEQTRKLVVAK